MFDNGEAASDNRVGDLTLNTEIFFEGRQSSPDRLDEAVPKLRAPRFILG
ncbi:hypothetical protein HGG72_08480 [Ochrobactrum pecoris]|nr:hypothetical protein [Brucella pecoris]